MQIYNRKISEKKIIKIQKAVTKKKDLVNLDRDFIKKHARKFLEQNTNILDYISETDNPEKSKKFKSLIKHIRDKARKVYGIFQTADVEKREQLLDRYTKTKERSYLKQLLNTHRSTKERTDYNKELYKKIFSRTTTPKSILDLGCGLNPLTFHYMELKPSTRYISAEFSQKDVDFLNLFFKKSGMKNSKAIKLDLLKDYNKLSDYNTDICFLFKVLDSLETEQQNISYEIIKNIKARYIIVSFPLYSITGKKMKLQSRNWFEKLAIRLDFELSSFDMKNELFYILKQE